MFSTAESISSLIMVVSTEFSSPELLLGLTLSFSFSPSLFKMAYTFTSLISIALRIIFLSKLVVAICSDEDMLLYVISNDWK